MASVLPTKGNLIATKRSRELAMTGWELMDRKRNILVREMMELMDAASALQSEIGQTFGEAYAALQRANIDLGLCQKAAGAVPVDETLTIQWRSVMGVELPHIPDHSGPPRPEYGMMYSSPTLDEAYIKFRQVRDLTRRMAETETAIYRLAQAIRKAQKRANALKNIVIPGFDETIRVITEALEEHERDEFVRMKVVKQQNERKK